MTPTEILTGLIVLAFAIFAGFLISKLLIKIKEKMIIGRARKQIENQKIDFVIDGKAYDLKGEIEKGIKLTEKITIPKPKK